LSFAGLADLLAAVPEQIFASLTAPQRAALDVALLRTSATRPPERRLVAAALLSVLRALATSTEVVLALDDLQWLDTPSSSALEFALRRLTTESIVAIV